MGILNRIFKVAPKNTDSVSETHSDDVSNLQSDNKPEANQKKSKVMLELFEIEEFKLYVDKVCENKNLVNDDLSEADVIALYEVWKQKSDSNSSSNNNGLLMAGVAALAVTAMYPQKAEAASIGELIGTKIVEAIGPFIEGLMATVMSGLGMDIQNGADKNAAAAGKTADAQNEVLKTIYNKEASRAAEPAPGECVAKEHAAKTVQVEQQSNDNYQDFLTQDKRNGIYLSTSYRTATQRMRARREQANASALASQNVPASATNEEKISALITVAASTANTGKEELSTSEVKVAKAHAQLLFADTESKIDVAVLPDTPVNEEITQGRLESLAALQYCKNIFIKDVAERSSVGGASSRSIITQKIQSEYGSAEFLEELNSKTHAAPVLKTLVMQQAFANMLAVKQYEQSADVIKLLALQLKETIKQNIRGA